MELTEGATPSKMQAFLCFQISQDYKGVYSFLLFFFHLLQHFLPQISNVAFPLLGYAITKIQRS
jgi:hypothetical protein